MNDLQSLFCRFDLRLSCWHCLVVTEIAQIRGGLFTPAEGRKESCCCCCCFRTSKSIRRFQNGKGYTTASFSRSLQLKKAFTARNAAGSRLEKRRRAGGRSVLKSNLVNELALLQITGRDDRCRYKTTSNFSWVSCMVVLLFFFFIIIDHQQWEFASFCHSSRSYDWLGFWSSYAWLGFRSW